MKNRRKSILYIAIILWEFYAITGILKNYSHYSFGDWLAIFPLVFLPCFLIYRIQTKHIKDESNEQRKGERIMGLLDIFKVSKFKSENERIKSENERIKIENAELQAKIASLGVNEYFETKAKIEQLEKDAELNSQKLNEEIASNNTIISELYTKIAGLQSKETKLKKSIITQEQKIARCKELCKSVDYAINNFLDLTVPYDNCKISSKDFDELELISPSIMLKLHCMDVKSLRKAYRENEKQIASLLSQYSARYTTKANKSIYNLMVIALRAEIQNILYNLKYEKLDSSIEDVKTVTAKYLKIAGEGNQSIAGTLTKFIGEIEYLFINAVKIEYNYYVKKEQARQEQLAIREQMRQEAEERKALESERKKVEREEEKFNNEIAKIQETISQTTDNTELEKLKSRIIELQNQLGQVIVKKEEITNLQNGKAGTVYIISNLGSFGEDMFKIGMTRRLEPQERVNELGSASVPFKFDVHSFIFSDDAVALETKMHQILHSKRVNKVNMRKEFFKISLDELEAIVEEIDPTAEFSKTMLAEEYRQSISSDEIYSSDYTIDDEDSDDD